MAHDVFISYSSQDKAEADAACAVLESNGIRCWIAPRDVLGKWGLSITQAIYDSRCLVLILSANSNNSPNVEDELALAASQRIAILPLRIEAVEPSKDIELWLKKHHWLDALTRPLERHLQTLAKAVALLLQLAEATHPSEEAPPTKDVRNIDELREDRATKQKKTSDAQEEGELVNDDEEENREHRRISELWRIGEWDGL